MSRSDPKRYEVTLRRDVQQVLTVCVDAYSKQEAIDLLEGCADGLTWENEHIIGAHSPIAKVLK